MAINHCISAGVAPQLLSLRRVPVRSMIRCWRAAHSSDSTTTVTPPGPAARTLSKPLPVTIRGKSFDTDSMFNVPTNVAAAASRELHLQEDHPIAITRQIIEAQFPAPTFTYHNSFHPAVSTHENFDSLGFPTDHPGRSRSDTYYINQNTLLRTHTSAHEAELFRLNPSDGYLISADVYRRDEIDRNHYPVFHQMEGARMWDRDTVPNGDIVAAVREDLSRLPTHDIVVADPNPPFHSERNPLQEPHHSAEEVGAIAAHLKRSLELMVVDVFSRAEAAARVGGSTSTANKPLQMRWIEAYFPFTSPSWELEVHHAGDWLEVLGCGVTKHELYANAGASSRLGWAFGIGLDRIAMLLFQIPDIRLFWSRDVRFLNQFTGVSKDLSRLRQFVPFSKHPPCPKDVSFWLSERSTAGGNTARVGTIDFHENDFMEIVRSVTGDIVEDVRLMDTYTHPKTGCRSMCYRINYRSFERTLKNEEANELHARVSDALVKNLGVKIR